MINVLLGDSCCFICAVESTTLLEHNCHYKPIMNVAFKTYVYRKIWMANDLPHNPLGPTQYLRSRLRIWMARLKLQPSTTGIQHARRIQHEAPKETCSKTAPIISTISLGFPQTSTKCKKLSHYHPKVPACNP